MQGFSYFCEEFGTVGVVAVDAEGVAGCGEAEGLVDCFLVIVDDGDEVGSREKLVVVVVAAVDEAFADEGDLGSHCGSDMGGVFGEAHEGELGGFEEVE